MVEEGSAGLGILGPEDWFISRGQGRRVLRWLVMLMVEGGGDGNGRRGNDYGITVPAVVVTVAEAEVVVLWTGGHHPFTVGSLISDGSGKSSLDCLLCEDECSPPPFGHFPVNLRYLNV
ncbi:hypothetical protein GH714_008836 [Hevea brasiliensis]|uniref:Uncharacterized protein n=1 Tax=Hevea brasiliensis TaxID=3981 RepID=A0A6A6LWS3_HEVBR|nr:hypothetical protein GH714_008836 [Hevea brasiliensis]